MGALAVVGVYGYSDSGKTRLLAEVIPRLVAEGIRVATVKCTEQAVSLDTPGKDTQVHRKAGAAVVVFSAAAETDFLVPRALTMQEVAAVIADGGLGAVDLVLVEGAREEWIPKIQVGECPERPNTIGRYVRDVDKAVRLIHMVLQDQKEKGSVLQVLVNGKEVPLSEFPELILTNVLLGMLSSLKGVGEIASARISLSCNPPRQG